MKQLIDKCASRIKLKFCLIALSTLIAFLFRPSPAAAAPLKWEKLSGDLEYLSYNPQADSIISYEMLFFRSALKQYVPAIRYAPETEPKSVKELCKGNDYVLCLNANFFDEHSKPLGLVIHNGKTISKLHKGGSLLNGIVSFDKSSIRIFPRSQFKEGNASNALQAGPILLLNGRPYAKLKSPQKESRRAGICIDNQNRLIIFCSAGEFSGPSLSQLTSILMKPGINCRHALNFDGGGSAQLFVNSKMLNAGKLSKDFFAGQDEVPVAFGLSSK